MTSPPPTLRCLACGYDIASLVETRGRDDPGVCPECGEDLRKTVLERPGTPVQRRGRLQGYLPFLWLATIRPSALVNSMRLGAESTGAVMYDNCIAAGVSAFVTSNIVGGILGLIYADPALLGKSLFAGAILCVFTVLVGLLLLPVFAFVSGAIAWGEVDMRGRMGAALDVGTVWMVWGPPMWAAWLAIVATLVWHLVMTEAFAVTVATAGVSVTPLLVIVRTVSTLYAIRSVETEPPSVPPPPNAPPPRT